jgi:hypothetical protein
MYRVVIYHDFSFRDPKMEAHRRQKMEAHRRQKMEAHRRQKMEAVYIDIGLYKVFNEVNKC